MTLHTGMDIDIVWAEFDTENSRLVHAYFSLYFTTFYWVRK
jgi:hypothetical protein